MKVFWAGAGLLVVFLVSGATAFAQTSIPFTQNLAYGSHGVAVTALQNFLTSEGVYSGPITGNFLSLTRTAVKAFQTKEDITPVSGYFGPLTRASANALLALVTTNTTSSVVTTVTTNPTTTPVVTTPTTVLATTTSPNSSLIHQSSTATSTTTTSASAPAVSKGSVQWGAYVGDGTSDAATFESEVGAKMNLQAVFVGWGNDNGPFPSQYASTVAAQGKTLVIFWEPGDGSGSLNEPTYNYNSITSGSWDSYFQTFAAAAKAYGGNVIIVPFAEMNGNWDPWDGTVNGNSAASFIAAWQHMHSFFGADSNVKWAWDVNSDSEPNTTANSVAAYYPGSQYVDYVGEDVFNFANPWSSFAQIAGATLSQLKTYGKPIYLFSIASEQGTQKAAWITDALNVQIPSDGIAGWIWFNVNKEQDWLVNSDPASLTAFQAGIPK